MPARSEMEVAPAGAGRGGLIAAFVVCVAAGILLAALPHFAWWMRLGEPFYIADGDELIYLTFAGRAYFEHPGHLSDPILRAEGPSIYPWIQFAPGILGAKMMRLGPLGISLCWRVWAGVTIGLAWFVLLNHYVKRRWLATALTVFVMCDAGMIWLRPAVLQFYYTARILRGQPGILLGLTPTVHPQWRIITPGLGLAYLLVHLWLVARARAVPSWQRIGWSAAGFALLFYVYFYYWTTAALALAIAFLLDRGHRRVYAITAVLGLLGGLPAVIAGMILKQSNSVEWLQRSDKFTPIGHTTELLLPKIAYFVLVVALIWVWARRRDLLYPWALACAGLLLLNHQLLTGLQIENFHWSYAWSPALLLMVLLGAAAITPRWQKVKWATWALALALSAFFALGVWLRWVEAVDTQGTNEIMDSYRAYRAQRTDQNAPRLQPNSVLGGVPMFVSLAAVVEDQRPVDHNAAIFSPAIDDDTWDTRVALNGYLRGLDRREFEADQVDYLDKNLWGPEYRDPARARERLRRRLRAFDQAAADPAAEMDRFELRYVALAHDGKIPGYLRRGWSRLQSGPTWDLWERAASGLRPATPER